MSTAPALDTTPVPSFPGLLRLDGRGVVVVGAGQGIGRQTAHAMASVGAKVLCVDIDDARAKHVATEVGGVPFVADARDRTGAEQILDEARRSLVDVYGIVDILGMARYAEIVDTSDEDWDWTFGMVLRHAFLMTQLGGRLLAEAGGGSIVLVGSISGMGSAPFHGAYGAAKAGLLSMMRTAAVELGPKGVRVNAVSPGTTATPRIVEARAARGDSAPDPCPLGGLNDTSDIAAAILYLTSGLARRVTGHALVVDAGATCMYPYPLMGLT